MRENELRYQFEEGGVISRAQDERSAFIRRTYAHLAGSILALVGLEAAMLQLVDGQMIMNTFFFHPFSWLIVLAVFMAAGFIARSWARSQTSPALQYAGLALYIVTWAIMFLPILYFASNFSDPSVIPTAGIMTLSVFAGLTLTVFVTGKDFSFLAPVIAVGSMVALGVIIAAILFGFTLGLFFSFAMVALIAGYILYDTSNVLNHYPTNMHIAAALELFADVALLFWYILQIVMLSRD